MFKKNKLVLLIFVLTLILRLYLAFQTSEFTYESYSHLRQVDHITNNFVPLYEDDLSYGGRTLFFLPFFHYFVAFFNLFLPLEVLAKVLSNLLYCLLIPLVYLIAKKVSKNDVGAMLSALIAALLPINFSVNSFSPFPFILLFTFLTVNFFLDYGEKGFKEKGLYYFIISFVIASLSSALSSVIIFSLFIYILYSKLDSKNIRSGEVELILFSSFFFLWVQFIFYKRVLLEEGIKFIWQNVPNTILLSYFPNFDLTQTVLLIGFLPLLAGIFLIYNSLFSYKNKNLFFMISLAIGSIILSWLKFIPFERSLSFIGLILAIIFASFYQQLITYYKRSKLSLYDESLKKKIKQNLPLKNFVNISSLVIIVLIIPSMIFPAIGFATSLDTPSEEEVELFKWFQTEGLDNSIEDWGILANLKEGGLVNYYSNRQNVMDLRFSLIDDVEERLIDIETLYTSKFRTEALKLSDQYNLKYIILTNSTKEIMGVEQLDYFNEKCFSLVYNNTAGEIYKVECSLSVSRANGMTN